LQELRVQLVEDSVLLGVPALFILRLDLALSLLFVGLALNFFSVWTQFL
jgi:hypothetical protein